MGQTQSKECADEMGTDNLSVEDAKATSTFCDD